MCNANTRDMNGTLQIYGVLLVIVIVALFLKRPKKSEPFKNKVKRSRFFVHIPKTGGFALRSRFPHFMHNTIETVKKKLKKPEKYIFFSFVRNPWDRLVSAYFFGKEICKNDKRLVQFCQESPNFEEFVKKLTPQNIREFLHLTPQYEFVCDKNGNIAVDELYSFEEYDTVVKKLTGITPIKSNSSNHDHYASYYNIETMEQVRKLYKRDIELFDFFF